MPTVARLTLCLTLLAPGLTAAPSDEAPVRVGPDGVGAVGAAASTVEARSLPAPKEWQPGDPIKEIPRRSTSQPQPPVAKPGADGPDVLAELQEKAGYGRQGEAFGTPLFTVAGEGFTGVQPPDTVGDVGPNHYIQAVNNSSSSVIRVYNKSGTLLNSFVLADLLTSGACATGAGDPIVLYDPYVDRWWLTEFADQSVGNHLCVYVSQTPDPLGAYWVYDIGTTSFPDYPKYGVMQDAIYFGTNENVPRIYALNKAPMLTGGSTNWVWFNLTSLSGFGFQMLVPADGDGVVPPPPGSPGIFARHLDSEVHTVSPAPPAGKDYLQLFLLQPNFVTPASSVLTGPINLQVADFSSRLCGLSSFSCIPQPSGTTPLDPLREVVMHRLQYRNFRRHQTLVGSFATNLSVDPALRAGVRWFELRNTGAGWYLHQEGTWSPDTTHRWMPGVAMDGHGNIAAAYSVSSGSLFPSLRYSGRTVGAAAGTFDQAEASFFAGSSSQSGVRWGDYAALSVDPADECTFWFTSEYGVGSSWGTRVGAFKFDVCRPFLKGDLNGDLKPDLLLRHTSGAHEVWLMNGTTRTSTGSLSPSPATNMLISGVDDFNADNKNDLVMIDASTGAGEFWMMNGLSRVGAAVPLVGAATPWKLSATADFNRDGRADLVWRNFSTQKIAMWLMNGTTMAASVVPTPDQAVDGNWEIVGTLDYNGDGYVDFMWYNPFSGKIVSWFLNASYVRTNGNFTNPSNAGNNNWKVLASADYGVGIDGADAAPPVPGSHDLIWRNASSGNFVVWHLDYARNRTHGLFTSPAAPATTPTSWTIVGPR